MSASKKNKILILADDLTGAFDTGISFVQQGIFTQVISFSENFFVALSKTIYKEDPYVLVINTETRHLSAEEAYKRFQFIYQKIRLFPFSYIYKKTDSVLRGNIGSELFATLQENEISVLHFIPAFPSAGRTTKHGIQLWNGVPIHETVFGQDYLNPLHTSQISDIIHQQSSVTTLSLSPNINFQKLLDFKHFQGIIIWDSESEHDFVSLILLLLKKTEEPPAILAGCGGFAKYLPRLWSIVGSYHPAIPPISRLVILCGSIHPVTQKQIAFAKQHGIREIKLSLKQKICPDYYETEEGQLFLYSLSQILNSEQILLIDTTEPVTENTTFLLQQKSMDPSSIRQQITRCLSYIGRYFFQCNSCDSFFLTGGDTAAAFIQELSIDSLFPLCAIGEGTVFSQAKCGNKNIHIFSKSGGLGEKDIFIKTQKLLQTEGA